MSTGGYQGPIKAPKQNSRQKAFHLGHDHALRQCSTINQCSFIKIADRARLYDRRLPDKCPYNKESPEAKEYDRGWAAAVKLYRGPTNGR